MNCAETRNSVHSYIDGELDLSKVIDVERHLRECAACRDIHERYAATRALLRNHATYFASPASLHGKIHAMLEAERGQPVPRSRARSATPPAVGPVQTAAVRGSVWRPSWFRLGASLALCAILALAFVVPMPGIRDADRLPEEIVSSHVRAIMTGHLADVGAPDRRAIEPWFDRKLAFSPPVADFDAQGFPLVGARLDYILHRPVAALVYRHAGHLINVFAWPASRTESPFQTRSREGFHLVNWNQSGMFYCAVSDLPADQLAAFARLLRTQAG